MRWCLLYKSLHISSCLPPIYFEAGVASAILAANTVLPSEIGVRKGGAPVVSILQTYIVRVDAAPATHAVTSAIASYVVVRKESSQSVQVKRSKNRRKQPRKEPVKSCFSAQGLVRFGSHGNTPPQHSYRRMQIGIARRVHQKGVCVRIVQERNSRKSIIKVNGPWVLAGNAETVSKRLVRKVLQRRGDSMFAADARRKNIASHFQSISRINLTLRAFAAVFVWKPQDKRDGR